MLLPCLVVLPSPAVLLLRSKKKEESDAASVPPAAPLSSASSDVHPLTSYVVNYLLLLCNK